MRGARLRVLALAALLALHGPASAERLVTEVIPLHYRTLEEILPVLRPLVDPPGGISGMSGQLVVRATPDNLADLRRVLASLDTRPRTLEISVRQGARDHSTLNEAEAFARLERDGVTVRGGHPREHRPGLTILGGEGRDRVGARVLDTRRERDDQVTQRLRVMEGREAYIQTGRSMPVGERSVVISGGVASVQDSVRYQEANTGFYVIPRLRGDEVLLELSPERRRFVPGGGGALEGSRSATTVSARLGEWVEIGAVDERTDDGERGTVYSTRSQRTERQRIAVKVELVGE